ncbi:RHS repeat domain-containing protein [Flavobacterium sp. GSA192]|uniref:RHS repeat domain-containing protein n=1 Tax=Flavobacterium sp. GSA192 TaxID=2576304 RepID=UPI00112B74EE|nr:RHS repeat-associated core domain-containing protein [Flavobacterium sp. GSA192]
MMKNILSLLVLLPMFIFGYPKKGYPKKENPLFQKVINSKPITTSTNVVTQYSDFNYTVTGNYIGSYDGSENGYIRMQNNIFEVAIDMVWDYGVYYNTGDYIDLNCYPALPDMQLGQIYGQNGIETGFFAKIENNRFIIYSTDPNNYSYFTQFSLFFEVDMNCVSYWYEDKDNDGYGNPDFIPLANCYDPSDGSNFYVTNILDCDDNDDNITYKRWYADNDNDGYGSTEYVDSCTSPGAYYSLNNTDCDDTDPTVHMTASWALDVNGDGILSDLDGTPSYVNSCTKPNGNYIPVTDDQNHWIHEVSFDVDGNVTGASRTFFNDLGKSNVTLSKDFSNNKIWGTETVYDGFNRPYISTFVAPSIYTDFRKNKFFQSFNLSSYYSNSNTDEPYQDTATQPYLQTNYDLLNPSNIINTVGGNKINNDWKTGYSYTVPAAQEMYYVYGSDYYDGTITSGKEEVITKFFKTVSVDANGIENVSFSDGEGKVLATARSGGSTSYPVVSLIGTQGFVDVHIPAGITSGQISLIGGASLYSVFNLKTGGYATYPLTGGNAYRIKPFVTPVTDPKTYILGGVPTYDSGALGITYAVNYYDYAVNVYNKTGQLVKSVQPNGFQLNSTVVAQPAYMSPLATNFISTYTYNDQGQLKEVVSPDEGTSKFLYRQDGQIRYSQSTLQADTKVSYTDYDTYGRPIESGVIANNWATASVNPDAALISGARNEQTITIYDYVDNNQTSVTIPPHLSLSSLLTAEGLTAVYYKQQNLSGNVAVTFTKPDTNITAISWYSYDVYGRTEWMAQYNEGLGIKTTHYYYERNGNLRSVVFQKDKTAEQFTHRFTYDINSVLTKVETATYGTSFITHADYSYYQTGELKRVNIAQGIQGLDYVYTLGGQLKSINHPSLEASKDPGGDSNDLFGITLDYYAGDYQRSNTNVMTSPSLTSADYNGNIKAARWANKNTMMDLSGSTVNQKGYLYDYDRNNWLTSASFGDTNTSTAAISPLTKYKEAGLSYDANGNIKNLQRTNASGNVQDNLTYNYNANKNQLNSVTDAAGASTNVNDIGNQAAGNYVYDAIGQLIQNTSENLYYFYNTQGLVTEVRLGATNSILKFFYNERGQRIRKESYATNGSGALVSTSYYALDLSGNTMAVYNKPVSGSIVQADLPIYGLSRLGVYNRAGAVSNYEITDHLGNVRAVIQKVNGNPIMQAYADYYPFGEQLPYRNSLSNYRYAFQGQELDTETNMEAFQLRLWDGRIGRWLSIDPAGEFHSPYLGMGNNPINAVDPDGGDIIYLNSSEAVFGFGHAAVLIGNDKDGWRYLSMNGTGEGQAPFGKSKYADLGNIKARKIKGRWIGNDFRKTGLTAAEVMKAVNKSNLKESHNYDRAIRIKTSGFEDEIAYQAAKKQASGENYNIFGCSCLDVPQQSFASVVLHRMGKPVDKGYNGFDFMDQGRFGFEVLTPNTYFDMFNHFMNNINTRFRINNTPKAKFEYSKILNPRDF